MNFKNIPEFKSLAEARAFVQSLASTHAETLEALEAKQKLVAERDEQIASLTTDLDSERAALKQTQSDLATARQSAQSLQSKVDALEKAQKSAESKAAEMCASVGVTPVAASPKSEDKGRDLMEQFKAIQSPAAQTAFYRKHREELNALMNQPAR